MSCARRLAGPVQTRRAARGFLEPARGPCRRPSRGAVRRRRRPTASSPRRTSSPSDGLVAAGAASARTPPAAPWSRRRRRSYGERCHPRRRDPAHPPGRAGSARRRCLAHGRQPGCNAGWSTGIEEGGSTESSDRASPISIRDRSLVEAAQADPRRFDALYRKYVAQVYSYAVYELGDHHDAEDATERTFLLRCARCRGSRSAPGRPTATAPRRSGSGCSGSPATRSPHGAAGRAATRGTARAAEPTRRPARLEAARRPSRRGRARLARHRPAPGDRRRALILRFVDEMSTAEIAGVLGRSEGAVRVLIHRALRHVADDLGRDRDGDAAPRPAGATTARSRRSWSTATSSRCWPAARSTPTLSTPALDAMPPRRAAGATCRASTRPSASRSGSPHRLARRRRACAGRRGRWRGPVVPSCRRGPRRRDLGVRRRALGRPRATASSSAACSPRRPSHWPARPTWPGACAARRPTR